MKRKSMTVVGLLLVVTAVHLPVFAQQTYNGMCDASAAIAIDDAHFLVAGDEEDVLRLYRNDGLKNTPVGPGFDLAFELRTDLDRESDIEGAARIGDRVYWITSHGRDGKGKFRENRYRLFATDVTGTSSALTLTWVGRYDKLIQDMLQKDSWEKPNTDQTKETIELLEKATKLDKKEVPKRAPKEKGLNIEALAALPDGSGLLIGFRNPIPEDKALVIPLKNPAALVAGKETVAQFGQPYYFDLDKLGLRAMAYCPKIEAFLLVAGPPGDKGSFKLFKWDRTLEAPPVFIRDLRSKKGLNPEAVVIYSDCSQIQILHDEGSKLIEGEECKALPLSKRKFSDRWYSLD